MSTLNDTVAGDGHFHITNVAQLQRWLPWLRMFRGFRLAIDYQKIALALVAVVLWGFGSHLLSSLILTDELVTENSVADSVPEGQSFSPAGLAWTEKINQRTFWNGLALSEPYKTSLTGARRVSWFYERVTLSFLGLASYRNFRWWGHAWLQLLWSLAIAAVFGGVIARMAARELTGHGRSILRDSQYGLKQAPVVFFAPFISLMSFAFLWSLNWISGFVGRVPVMGELALALCWGVFLFCGLLLFLLLLGMILGWPLMLCSGAVEKNDTFDALSRAFSYLLNRPWYALFLTSIAFAYGSLTLMFVVFATNMSLVLSLSSVAAGHGQEFQFNSLSALFSITEPSLTLFQNGLSSQILKLWIEIALLIPAAYGFSFFWTSTTIGYLLLRRREDGTPLHEIDLSDSNFAGRPELAVVGIPAAELRESNRNKSSHSI